MLTQHCEHDTFVMSCVRMLCVHMHIIIKLTLASFMLQGVLSWSPCHPVSQPDIVFGVNWLPQNIPLKVTILQSMMVILSIHWVCNHAAFVDILDSIHVLTTKTLC